MTMTNTPATPKQLKLLRRLANSTGTSFVWPRDRRHASQQIDEMLRRPRSTRLDRDLDDVAVRGGTLSDRD